MQLKNWGQAVQVNQQGQLKDHCSWNETGQIPWVSWAKMVGTTGCPPSSRNESGHFSSKQWQQLKTWSYKSQIAQPHFLSKAGTMSHSYRVKTEPPLQGSVPLLLYISVIFLWKYSTYWYCQGHFFLFGRHSKKTRCASYTWSMIYKKKRYILGLLTLKVIPLHTLWAFIQIKLLWKISRIINSAFWKHCPTSKRCEIS